MIFVGTGLGNPAIMVAGSLACKTDMLERTFFLFFIDRYVLVAAPILYMLNLSELILNVSVIFKCILNCCYKCESSVLQRSKD